MNRIVLLIKVMAAVLVPLLFAACEKAPQPPLVFGASPWAGYESVYLARELGYFQGGNLRLDEYASPAEAEQAIRTRKAHLAAITLERALLLHSEIPDLKIILLFDAESAGAPQPGGKAGTGQRAPAKRVDVLVTRDETIGEYHQELGLLLSGWRRALDYLHSEPDKAMQIMAQREHVTPAEFKAQFDKLELYGLQRNQQLMIGEPAPIGAEIEAWQRVLLNDGRLNIGADPSILLDSTLLAESPK